MAGRSDSWLFEQLLDLKEGFSLGVVYQSVGWVGLGWFGLVWFGLV